MKIPSQAIDTDGRIRQRLCGVDIADVPTMILFEPEIGAYQDRQHAMWMEDRDGDAAMVYGYRDGDEWVEVATYDGVDLAGELHHPPGFSRAPVGATLRFMWMTLTAAHPPTLKVWIPRSDVATVSA